MRAELPAATKVPPAPIKRRPIRAIVLHVFRLALLAVIVGLIHWRHREFEARLAANGITAINVESVRVLFPSAARVTANGNATYSVPHQDAKNSAPSNTADRVLDADGKLLGYVVQTSPQSDRVIGFSGATNVLIGFDEQERIIGIRILASRDTREHISHVERDQRFLSQWNGKSWSEAASLPRVDTVSGATLSSLAVSEGLTLRLGGQQPALRFPDRLRITEITPFLPTAQSFRLRPDQPAINDVLNVLGQPIGFVVRTTPTADAVIGYQGPTDTLLVFNDSSMLVGMSIRKSYDNEPYVGYVRDEASFAGLFIDRGFRELSHLDPKAEGIEGVSGATMTSMAIARGIAPALQIADVRTIPKRANENWSIRDMGTVLVLLTAGIMSATRRRGERIQRVLFQVVLVGYLGFVNGDLLSQASLVGWAQVGIPWRTAPGLTLLTAAALLVPTMSRTQFYCHQVCPFGAAQQLLTHGRVRALSTSILTRMTKLTRTQRRDANAVLRSPRVVTIALRAIPTVLLVLVVASALQHWSVSLVGLEPFDAFHVRIAGTATITVAVLGLVASAFSPMAYCRFGCPTGAMLNFLRFHSRSDCWSARDSVAVGLVLMAAML